MNKSNFDTLNNLHSFGYGHYNHVPPIRIYDIDALDLQDKPFLFTIFHLINVYLWNKTILNTRNNLYSFC